MNCTFVNNGTIRAGGGGGGTGGQGLTSSIVYSYSSSTNWLEDPGASTFIARYNNYVFGSGWGIQGLTQIGGYYKGALRSRQRREGNDYIERWEVGISQTSYFSGGAGGVGAGYNQSAGSGAGGGTNAGTGGSGGGFGASGSTGANGNSSNGSSGGAAGKYLRGSSFVTFTNNGTAQGGTA